jgi:hypothetical protein
MQPTQQAHAVGCLLTVLDEAPSDEERQLSLDGCIDLLKRVPIGFEAQRTAYDPKRSLRVAHRNGRVAWEADRPEPARFRRAVGTGRGGAAPRQRGIDRLVC